MASGNWLGNSVIELLYMIGMVFDRCQQVQELPGRNEIKASILVTQFSGASLQIYGYFTQVQYGYLANPKMLSHNSYSCITSDEVVRLGTAYVSC